MKLIKKKISDLKDHPLNEKTRRITSDALDKLEVSIDTLGTIQPIVWNERLDCICSGHQRVKAYKSKKIEEIDVWVVNLDEHDHCLAMYMLNNHFGEFDQDMLSNIVKSVKDTEDIEIDTLGFDENKIENFLKEDDIEGLPQEKFCSSIIFDNEEQKKAFTKLRTHFKDSSELAEFAVERLKTWT